MSAETKLANYSFDFVVQEVLQRRVPHFPDNLCKKWFLRPKTRPRVFGYLHCLAEGNVQLMDKLDIVRRTAEYARLYGIDFFSVLSRGSQYRVEAVYLRIAHSMGFLAVSGTKGQVSRMAPLECQALVMEPESGFYEDPVIVLDFQSLYPSMMIAHNLCFSTILGKLRRGEACGGPDTTGVLGFMPYPESSSAGHACRHGDETFVAPNGTLFCPRSSREGVLPIMLKELLATRQVDAFTPGCRYPKKTYLVTKNSCIS